jgi:hypothetical protein
MSKVIIITIGGISLICVGWLILPTPWFIFYVLCLFSSIFWILEENSKTKKLFPSKIVEDNFSIKILISKSIGWIAALDLGALILPRELFVVYFFSIIFIPLWIIDKRDDAVERRERRVEDARLKKAYLLYKKRYLK